MIYAIDLDGTLTIETEGHDYASRSPNLDRIAGVNRLFTKGHTIILFTSRFKQDRKVTKDWLSKFNVNYHKLILGKPQYDFIVDDKLMNPELLRYV